MDSRVDYLEKNVGDQGRVSVITTKEFPFHSDMDEGVAFKRRSQSYRDLLSDSSSRLKDSDSNASNHPSISNLGSDSPTETYFISNDESLEESLGPEIELSSVSSTMSSPQRSDGPSLKMLMSPSARGHLSLEPSISPSFASSAAPHVVSTEAERENLLSSSTSDTPSHIPSQQSWTLQTQNPSPIITYDERDISLLQPHGLESDPPSLIPSQSPATFPATSRQKSSMPSLVYNLDVTVFPSDIPSIVPISSSATPTSEGQEASASSMPSDVPSEMPNHELWKAPTVNPTYMMTNFPSEAPSLLMTQIPTRVRKTADSENNSIEPTNKASIEPFANFIQSDMPSDVPSSVPSHANQQDYFSNDAPSTMLTANDVPQSSFDRSTGSSYTPSQFSLPSTMPTPQTSHSISPSALKDSAVLTDDAAPAEGRDDIVSPTSQSPTTSPTILSRHDAIIVFSIKNTTFTGLMDATTIKIVEDVCSEEFLRLYLPLSYPANYEDISCFVLEQRFVNNSSRYLVDNQSQEQILELVVTLLVLGRVSLPSNISFEQLIERTFNGFIDEFILLLESTTPFFVVASHGSNYGTYVTQKEKFPLFIAAASIIGGGVALLMLAVFVIRNRKHSAEHVRYVTEKVSHADRSFESNEFLSHGIVEYPAEAPQTTSDVVLSSRADRRSSLSLSRSSLSSDSRDHDSDDGVSNIATIELGHMLPRKSKAGASLEESSTKESSSLKGLNLVHTTGESADDWKDDDKGPSLMSWLRMDKWRNLNQSQEQYKSDPPPTERSAYNSVDSPSENDETCTTTHSAEYVKTGGHIPGMLATCNDSCAEVSDAATNVADAGEVLLDLGQLEEEWSITKGNRLVDNNDGAKINGIYQQKKRPIEMNVEFCHNGQVIDRFGVESNVVRGGFGQDASADAHYRSSQPIQIDEDVPNARQVLSDLGRFEDEWSVSKGEGAGSTVVADAPYGLRPSIQIDVDVANARQVLSDLGRFEEELSVTRGDEGDDDYDNPSCMIETNNRPRVSSIQIDVDVANAGHVLSDLGRFEEEWSVTKGSGGVSSSSPCAEKSTSSCFDDTQTRVRVSCSADTPRQANTANKNYPGSRPPFFRRSVLSDDGSIMEMSSI